MLNLKNKPVLILGLGFSGLSMARWCTRQGAIVTVADTRELPPQLAHLQQDCPNARFVFGAFSADLLRLNNENNEVCLMQAIFCSPGLSPTTTNLICDEAKKAGIFVGSELSLFAQALADLKSQQNYDPAVLAITGTNGKTTVTSLTGQLVKRAGKSVAVAGNIGPALLDTLIFHLDQNHSDDLNHQQNEQNQNTLPDVWVLELSSFQLDGVQNFEPTAATILNITQDHLDWHGSMQAYKQAKARIFGEKTKIILNVDDPEVWDILKTKSLEAFTNQRDHATKKRASKKNKDANHQDHFDYPLLDYIGFGMRLPQKMGDFGLEESSNVTWLVCAPFDDEKEKSSKNKARKSSVHLSSDLYLQRLLPIDDLQIRGRHNAMNALAAIALAQAAGCALAPILFGLRDYAGEAHRVQSVAVINGVEYFDDSKGTNVGATVAALNGLGVERRLVVILGGDGKGQDFSDLAKPIQNYVRSVVLIGRDAPIIEKTLRTHLENPSHLDNLKTLNHSDGLRNSDDLKDSTQISWHHAASLPEAVKIASELAQTNDAVLLSPACASLDMFRNYEHRAQVFCEAVQALKDAVESLKNEQLKQS